MIKLIVGLGNPGRQYEKTRHNAGFLFLERLVSGLGGAWLEDARFQGLLAEVYIGGRKVLLLKPQTYMNKSGEAVGKIARYYKLDPQEILVVHDELDFDEGVVRIKKGGGHAGHNGLRDIIAHLGSKEFLRLRVGIGRPTVGVPVANYVLSRPAAEEMARIEGSFDKIESVIEKIIAADVTQVANLLHG
ncbi:aminoacyl-tRNA hydrolase [Methylomarinum vadi]|uniref:aminoacyl-tRNA hydrolase n=1 Tax=Methylomarinum vadi TaxID=438855 RepID=UPI0004DF0B06|nr:aminoacyl-tRNA hydrolase [Methylomarinum vadi]